MSTTENTATPDKPPAERPSGRPEALLAHFEAEFRSLADTFLTEFPRIRATRISARSLVAAIYEVANASAGDPARRKELATIAERLGGDARKLDVQVAAKLAQDGVLFGALTDDGSPMEQQA